MAERHEVCFNCGGVKGVTAGAMVLFYSVTNKGTGWRCDDSYKCKQRLGPCARCGRKPDDHEREWIPWAERAKRPISAERARGKPTQFGFAQFGRQLYELLEPPTRPFDHDFVRNAKAQAVIDEAYNKELVH